MDEETSPSFPFSGVVETVIYEVLIHDNDKNLSQGADKADGGLTVDIGGVPLMSEVITDGAALERIEDFENSQPSGDLPPIFRSPRRKGEKKLPNTSISSEEGNLFSTPIGSGTIIILSDVDSKRESTSTGVTARKGGHPKKRARKIIWTPDLDGSPDRGGPEDYGSMTF